MQVFEIDFDFESKQAVTGTWSPDHTQMSGLNYAGWKPSRNLEFDENGLVAAAKIKGIYKGRPPKIDMDGIKRRLSDGERPVDIARDLGVARSIVYKAKAQIGGSSEIKQ